MVETVAGQCGLEPVLADEVCGELSVERFPATARSILDSTLPRMGLLYLVEGENLYVMAEKDLRAYFQTRAVFRTYPARVTGSLLRRLLEAPDIVSTMGFLGIDPERGIVHIHDLPSFADRVEDLLVLVSVAILAIAMAVLLESIRNSISATQLSRERTKAAYLAQAKMWEMEDLLYWKSDYEAFDRDGTFESPDSDYRWEIRVDSDEDIAEHVVTVRVTWFHRKKEKSYELVTVVPMDRDDDKYLK
jgi:hypothetical protein